MFRPSASSDRRERLLSWRQATHRGWLSRAAFERLVEEALESVPAQFATRLENVAVVVEDRPSPGEDEHGTRDEDALLGLFEGGTLADRSGAYHLAAPDRITIYRLPLLDLCRTREEVVQEIRATVIHEVGHFFGLGDDELD